MEENSAQQQTDPWDSAIFGSSLQSMYRSVPASPSPKPDVSVPFPPPAKNDIVPPNVAPVIPRDIVRPVTPPSPIFSLRPDLARVSVAPTSPTVQPVAPSVPPAVVRPAPTVPPMPLRPSVSMPQVSAPSPAYSSAPAYAVPQMQMPIGHSPYISAEQRAAALSTDTRQSLRHANAGQLGQHTVAPISVASVRPVNNVPASSPIPVMSSPSRPLPMVLKAFAAILMIPMFGAGFLVADWSKKELARHDIQVTPEILQATLIRVQDVAENTIHRVEHKIRSVVVSATDSDSSR